MAKVEKPLDKRAADFVRFHLYDKQAFAAFTGQDFSAWRAFVYAVELWGRSDSRGATHALDAMRACVGAAQRTPDVLACFKKAIPCVLDWGREPTLWARIAPAALDVPSGFGFRFEHGVVWPCSDGERICSHLHSKPAKDRPGWFICKDKLCKALWRPTDRPEASP